MRLRFPAVTHDSEFYWERVDRNIGWLTFEEQEFIRGTAVGIAGTGGMGGILGPILARNGVGRIVIADNQVFDISNMNRQYAARKDTIGKNKADETAREILRITDDVSVEAYPEGINPNTVAEFVRGKNLVLDEIEFFSPAARILLHEECRKEKVPILNCNTIGFGLRLFYYTHKTMTVEEALGMTYAEALEVEHHMRKGSPTERMEALERIDQAVRRAFVPELPNYRPGDTQDVLGRIKQGIASIVGTNPFMAAGFLADQVFFELFRQLGSYRPGIKPPPPMPGYIYVEAGDIGKSKTVTEQWW
jgi:molybdopterin/thiamine biosynthesis adenylyltransferase